MNGVFNIKLKSSTLFPYTIFPAGISRIALREHVRVFDDSSSNKSFVFLKHGHRRTDFSLLQINAGFHESRLMYSHKGSINRKHFFLEQIVSLSLIHI